MPHKPRRCLDCGYQWTPEPWRLLALLYLVTGAVLFPAGSLGICLVFVWIREWHGDDLGFNWMRAFVTVVVLVGSPIAVAMGIGCLRFGYELLFPRRLDD